jgi:hypothetical protein
MLSNLTGYLFGTSTEAKNEEEIVNESDSGGGSTGVLYKRNKLSDEWNCFFLEAKAIVRVKGNYMFDLVVERLEDPPDEGDEIFIIEPLSTALGCRLCQGPDGPGVAWKTARGEWLIEFEDDKGAKTFFLQLSRSLYSTHYQRTPGTDEQVHKFMQDLQRSKPTTQTTSSSTQSTPSYKLQSPKIDDTIQQYNIIDQSPYKAQNSKIGSTIQSNSNNNNNNNNNNNTYDNKSPLLKITPKKYTHSPPRFNPQKASDFLTGEEIRFSTGLFSVQSGGDNLLIGTDVRISIIENGPECYVRLQNKGEIIHSWPLSTDVSLKYDAENRSMTWVADMGEGIQGVFVFCFLTYHSYSEFQKDIMARSYSIKSKAKVSKDDLDWQLDGLSSKIIQMRIDDKDEEEEQYVHNATPYKATKSNYVTDSPTKFVDSSLKGKNSLLSVGRSNDRTYVVRGNNIGVFSPSKKSMKFQSSFSVESPNKKIPFSPAKTMLHKADKNLLLIHPQENKKIFCMDLERGKVVEEWDTDGFKLNTILPESKESQSQGTDCFVGVNNAGFFVVDPRSQKKVVRTHQYSNANSTHFRCGATTTEGDLAIGTGLGEVRLFSHDTLAKQGEAIGSGPRAKTRLVGYGDPILAIDVTKDGKFVLATCESYLIMCPVEDETGSHTGFKKSVKRSPILLKLTHEDIIQVGGKVQFTPAKFNIVGEETWIVSSTANWIIIWNFADLVHNDGDGPKTITYKKKWLPDAVVADDFTINGEGEIVLTMPDDVRVYHCDDK